MKVSDIMQLDSHAVIGGGAVENFGMADTAEFYTVLSDTLYGKKKRAAVREPMCNAWDIHIKTGVSRPIEVTVTETSLEIRDFGTGISPENIRPIYCIYGGTTKLESVDENGGFGLGSKAPFAISDHFTVISYHKGVKTTWLISRGGIDSKGKPSARPMSRSDTDQTGLTVIIPIGEGDYSRILKIVKETAREGAMPTLVNGELIEPLPFKDATSCYIAVDLADTHLCEKVILRYGTVLYPMHGAEDGLQRSIRELSDVVPNGMSIILMAPPNSIGVAPSREALSFSRKTIATIEALIKRTIGEQKNLHVKAVKDELRGLRSDDIQNFLGVCLSPGSRSVRGICAPAVTPIGVARLWAACRPSLFSFPGYKSLMMKVAMKRFPESRSVIRQLIKSHGVEGVEPNKVTIRTFLKKVIRVAVRANALNDLSVIFKTRDAATAKSTSPKYIGDLRDMRTEHIAIGANRTSIYTIAMSGPYDRKMVLSFMLPHRDVEKRAAICEAAKSMKIKVKQDERKIRAKTKKKPKSSELFINLKDVMRYPFETHAKLEDPKFFIVVSGNSAEQGWVSRVRDVLVSEFGDIAVVRSISYNKMIKLGVKDVMPLMLKKVKEKAKLKDMLIAALVQSSFITKTCAANFNQSSELRRAKYFLTSDPDLFFEFVPIRASSRDNVHKFAKMIQVLDVYPGRHPNLSFAAEEELEYGKVVHALQSKASRTFPKEILSENKFRRVWKDLESFETNIVTDATFTRDVLRLLKKRNLSNEGKEA